MVVLDGCPVRALKLARTPAIDEVAAHGAHTEACRSVCPTVTYTAHASIITGRQPAEHGLVGNVFYDRESGRLVNLDAEPPDERLRASTLFERERALSLAVGEPITRGADLVVSKAQVQAHDPREQDAFALRRAAELVREHAPGLAVINLPGIDRVGELYGPTSRELLEHLEEVDALLGELTHVLDEVYEDYLLVLLADHGMVPVRENVDLAELLEGLEAVICPSHRAAHIYLADQAELGEALERLRSDGRLELVLTRDKMAEYGLHNPLSGDIFVAAKEGYELGPEELRGSHGGVSHDEMMVFLIANKPEYADLLKDARITRAAEAVERYLREARAIEQAKEFLAQADPAHGWEHTERVLKLATDLALEHGADVEAVRLAAIFHDVGRRAVEHSEESARLAAAFLLAEGWPEERVGLVRQAILKHHAEPGELKELEERILWEADKLDALGLVGLARCLLEAGSRGEGIEEAIEHLMRDVRQFRSSFSLPTAREKAARRVAAALKAIKRLKDELEGRA